MDNPISRVTRPKEDARRYYNRLSRWYDLIAGGSEEKYRQTGMALLNVQPGERVLEIGFGTGNCLVAFAQATGPSGFVGGIELSGGMAAIARQRLIDSGLDQQAGLALADGAQPPFGPDCFDAIFMSFTLELFDTPDIPRVLERCRQMLHSRGRLVVVSLVKAKDPGMAERVYE
ncbi:MAG: methyltransferase domain-containing protein, partial [Chloroflexota bacterium]|nr:methyltransferase domain-containing protein [Chloroflexota bacterium]